MRLYPLDVERLPWEALADGVDARLLARDPRSGSSTRIVRAAPGALIPEAHPDTWQEVYVLAGATVLEGRGYGRGSYLCLPPGTRVEAWAGAEGLEAMRLDDFHPSTMDKPHVRLTGEEAEALEPEAAVSGVGGAQRTLAAGPSSCGETSTTS